MLQLPSLCLRSYLTSLALPPRFVPSLPPFAFLFHHRLALAGSAYAGAAAGAAVPAALARRSRRGSSHIGRLRSHYADAFKPKFVPCALCQKRAEEGAYIVDQRFSDETPPDIKIHSLANLVPMCKDHHLCFDAHSILLGGAPDSHRRLAFYRDSLDAKKQPIRLRLMRPEYDLEIKFAAVRFRLQHLNDRVCSVGRVVLKTLPDTDDELDVTPSSSVSCTSSSEDFSGSQSSSDDCDSSDADAGHLPAAGSKRPARDDPQTRPKRGRRR